MKKYRVNWDEISDGEEAPSLISAVARYLSVTKFPSETIIAAILGIEEDGETVNQQCMK